LADVRLARGNTGDAAMLLEEADDIVEGLLTRASSPWVRSRIIAGMDDVTDTRIRLEGARSRGNPARLFAVLERARARSLLDLLNSREAASDINRKEWRNGERRIASLQLQLMRTTSGNDEEWIRQNAPSCVRSHSLIETWSLPAGISVRASAPAFSRGVH